MRSLGAILLSTVATLGLAGPAQAELRVVGGNATAITQAPWQAALLWSGVQNTYNAQFCGATIRDATTVITAAHCVYGNYPASSLDVLAGTGDLGNGSGQRIRVAAVSIDPRYNPSTNDNDAALLTLTAPITLGTTATPLPLVTPTEALAIDAPDDGLLVSGWGSTIAYEPGQSAPSVRASGLRSVTVPFVSDATCGSRYSGFNAATMLCAGAPGKDSCQGDSGGPLAFRAGDGWRLAGIVSSGAGCGSALYPGIYTETAGPDIRSFLTGHSAAPETAPAPVPATAVAERDHANPRIELRRRQCTRATCSMLIAVSDPAPSSGIARVASSIESRARTCAPRRARRASACAAKAHALRARDGGGGLHTIVITRVRPGRHVVTITVSDRSGNRTQRRVALTAHAAGPFAR